MEKKTRGAGAGTEFACLFVAGSIWLTYLDERSIEEKNVYTLYLPWRNDCLH